VNPWDLSSSELLIWGIVLHLVADWPLQTDWMANNKAERRTRHMRRGDGMMTPPRMFQPSTPWWDRHPAAYFHAGIHGILLSAIFGWVAAPLALAHLLIDTRTPVVWWMKMMRQTQPKNQFTLTFPLTPNEETMLASLYDIGTTVRLWIDQVFHFVCIAVAALLVTAV